MSAHAPSLAGSEVTLGLGGEDGGDIVARSPTALFWRRFRQDRVAVASLVFIAVLAIVAIAAPLVGKLLGLPGPYIQNLNLTTAFAAPLGFSAVRAIVAIAAPLVVKLLGLPGPYIQSLNLTNAFGEPLGPSAAHPFGVDGLGEDIASRVIYGSP